ncbi:MAG: hypothetical protein D6729_18635 [Deltaproteobacteria bacterium]|nr:MAG: hypothetical protein D6729_18635 [Deltaproteobacteria bacterium]
MSRSDPEAAARVRNLVALDAENVMRRLRERRGEMVTIFSRRREREVLLGAVRSYFEVAEAAHLVHLSPEEQSATSAFYEALDRLRYYFRYTEDMPGTVERVIEQHFAELRGHYERLVRILGGPVPADLDDVPPAEVVEVEVVRGSG